MNRELLGTLLILTSAVSFGVMPIFARLAYADGVQLGELLFVRFIISSLVMGALLAVSEKFVRPSRRMIATLLVIGGVLYFFQAAFYYEALLYLPISLLMLVLYTYPAFVTVGAVSLGWEGLSCRLLGSVLLAFLGFLLVADFSGGVGLLGILTALGSSLTYAAYILSSSRALKNLSGEGAIFYVLVGAAFSFAIFGFASGEVRLAWGWEAWLWVVLIVLISTCLATTTFFQGLKLVGPTKTSVLSIVEPVTAILAASVIFQESMNLQQALGGLLVLTAALIAAFSRSDTR